MKKITLIIALVAFVGSFSAMASVNVKSNSIELGEKDHKDCKKKDCKKCAEQKACSTKATTEKTCTKSTEGTTPCCAKKK